MDESTAGGVSSLFDLEGADRLASALAAIVQSSDDAIVSKTLDGMVASWNPAATRMFGYEASEMIGRSITTIIPADRLHEEYEVLSRIRAGERVDHFETVRRRKDGTPIHISLTVSPIKDATGRIVGASKVARDISERKAAEEAIRQSNAIKDQFLSLVSHELRTPIAVIVGNAQLLQRRAETLSAEDKLQALADITLEGERLQRIIENLLLLTRVEGGDVIELGYVQVERLLQHAISTFERRNAGRIVDFQAASIPPAVGEATLTIQVMENLLVNAHKYSPEGEVIEVRLGINERGEAEVHVLDRGIGLADEDPDALFAPFYRTSNAKDSAGGLGLGLAVCKKAIEEQGGSIGALPRNGGGADFWFTLPLAEEAQFA